MPIYEYSCGKCGASFEVLVRTERDVPAVCRACGSKRVSKSLSAFAVGKGASSLPGSCGSCAESGACPAAGGCAGGACPMG